MKLTEVKDKAKALGIRPGKLNKGELIRAIQRQEGNADCFDAGVAECDQLQCLWRSDCFPDWRD